MILLTFLGASKSILDIDQSQAIVCNHMVELLCHLTKMHQNRIRFHLLSGNLLQKIALLMKSRDTTLKLGNLVMRSSGLTVLASIRFFRTIIGTKDEFYSRFLVKHDLLRPLMEAFEENGKKYNLLNSACLDFLEFIKTVLSFCVCVL